MSNLATLFPSREPIADAEQGLRVTARWNIYFRDLEQQIATIPSSTPGVAITTGQTASLPTTPFPGAVLAAGLYRVTSYVRILVAAGVSSSLIVTLFWTQGGASLSHAFTAVTGNTNTTVDSQQWTMLVDGGTPISYATTYASNPAGVMSYTLQLFREKLNA